MQRFLRAAVACCAALPGLLAPGAAPGAPALPEFPAPFAAPFPCTPLAHLRVTGGYGEVRSNHVHAGLDFSTGGHVGEAVRAPLAGAVTRVHASGAGYGRSLYLQGDDGRLLVFGHLDAFAPAVAAYVDSAQRAGGGYEQDLWPAAGRFRFAAGETLAWSGESGTGAPHLHFEVRHGDFALDPLLAGIEQAPAETPRIESLVLEPLDERSWVARRAGPRTVRLGGPPETLVVEGSVRAIVRARSGLESAAGSPPWATSVTWAGATLAARLDSISWAGEMAELDLVVDRGRITGGDGFVLWRPPGVAVRLLATAGAPWEGTIHVGPGEPARPLALRATDPDGHSAGRTVWLRGPREDERGADPSARAAAPGGARERVRPGEVRWSFAALPAGRLRVRVDGGPAGISDVRIGVTAGDGAPAGTPGTPASPDGTGWCAVLAPPRSGGPARFEAGGRRANGAAWSTSLAVTLIDVGGGHAASVGGGASVRVGPDDVFESGVAVALPAPGRSSAEQGLAALADGFTIEPEIWPMRRPVAVGVRLAARPDSATDLYRRGEAGEWQPLRARWDAARGLFEGLTSSFGTFALLRDVAPPRVAFARPPRRPPAGAYPRWEIVARVRESGSGVAAAASYFEIDGERVPTEWDSARSLFRWRPLVPPSPGPHRAVARVVDRAGHAGSAAARFVIDSARR